MKSVGWTAYSHVARVSTSDPRIRIMAKLKPWYQVVTPREDLRENRPLDASEFAVHLDHIRDGRAHPDYLEPARFFERTYLTKNLLDLSSQVVRRLSGQKVETSAVFNMATQFGGGKTHSLTALYHLANGGEKAARWKGVESILSQARVAKVPKAAVAVFVGTEFDVVEGRGNAGEPMRRTPWGEVAWQLGGEKCFNVVAKHDADGIAPAGDVIRKMLPDGPALILMDELLNYVSRARKIGLSDQFYNFLHNLSEEVRGRDNAVLCVSIPASELEMTAEDQRDHERLKKLLDRVGKAIMMSAETEFAEIIRRRLFEWHGHTDDANKVISEYADWAADHAGELAGVEASSSHEMFRTAYPFHPAVLSVFERKWQGLPRFQRTRGVLRLLALWVARAYQEEHRQASREVLIGLGSAPLDDPTFRAAVFEQLGSDRLEVPVVTDITGRKDSHAVRLDREATDEIKKTHLHQKAATAIFFESNGGQSQSRAEASVAEVKAAVGDPSINLADVDHVLEQLVTASFYLSWDKNRYRFSLSPNLNQLLVTRRAEVKPDAIAKRIREETEALFKDGQQTFERRFSPAKTNDVPDRPELTLVVMGPETPAGDPVTLRLMDSIVRDSGSTGRTFKSALIFTAPDLGSAAADAARNLLAWEAIDDDQESKTRLDDTQRRQLTESVKRAKKDLRESLWRSYRYLYLLNKENVLREVDLGQITSSMAGSLSELILNRLIKDDEVTDSVGANRLVKYWPPALAEWSTKALRDAFFSSPLLPRLVRGDVIKRTVATAVTQGLIGYAHRDPSGRMVLDRFNESLSELEVEVADDIFILKAEDARRLLEPPRIAQLMLRPDRVMLEPGERASFTLGALDQYGHSIAVSGIEWSSTTGGVSADGTLEAGPEAGRFVVRAKVGEHLASAEVSVAINESWKHRPQAEPPTPSVRTLSWSGALTPQKWMTFYTRVLSRVAALPSIRIRVEFSVPVQPENGQHLSDELRNGLREVGLLDEVHVVDSNNPQGS